MRDTLKGGADDDTINGGKGIDTIQGDAGDDIIVWTVGDGMDAVINGGSNTGADLFQLIGPASQSLDVQISASNSFLVVVGSETLDSFRD